ncbi:flagellin [Adhaeretor mobilis]|uniref:Flagellin n=1 Tax=Adhaeretor mobilis TaxID=1930276 RepID=A0A517MTW6_9BACT|nr:flagellin [Adhaeretor mobilis]QDS98325.1 B-type flagellin [Adhaeretor mobilis]
MSRINTNVSSLVAQNTLSRSNSGLNEALTRLSTGLKINTGKDDPAGLIASENLRSDITAIRRSISNTERATQVIATADSSLGQVSSLLNDIRGLVTESANAGALSEEQVAANQLQLDSSLEALNRIAQTTTFQGRRLLDGSLDFVTSAGTNFSNVSDLKIDQANLGATGSVSVDINVSAAATQAQVDVDNVPVEIAGVTSSDGTLTFATAAVAEVLSTGTFTVGTGGSDTITVTAVSGGAAAGTAGDDIDVVIVDDNGTANGVDSVTFAAGVLTVNADVTGGVGSDDIAAAIQAFNGGADFTSSSSATNNLIAGDIATNTDVTSGGVDGVDEVDALITIAAANDGTAFDRAITFVSTNDEGAGAFSVTDDGTTLAISVDDDTAVDLADLAAEIETQLNATDDDVQFTATLTDTTGDGQFDTTVDTDPTLVNVGATTAGVDSGGGIANAVVLELSGSNGSEVLSFGANTSIDDLVQGINLVSDATGVTATANGTTLELTSSTYGSESLVDINILSEGTGTTAAGTFTTAIADGERAEGSDIVATINGVEATGKGNELSINTASLDLQATLTADFTGTASFTIDDGGALFQLGPDVVSNQQARLGIGSVNTARLGGASGKLFQLGTGGSAELSTDANTAAKIVEEAIDQVTGLRGRLGAFQRTTLETNKNALNDTLVNLTEAESSIRDADFAAESAALTRSQILVQSGTTVLSIANQNPQNVLALLR